MIKIDVKLKNNPYSIYIKHGLLTKIPDYIKALNLGNFALILISKKVYSLYKKELAKLFPVKTHKFIYVKDGEELKTYNHLISILEKIMQKDTLQRKVYLLCIGGGTVGDIGAFAASIYKRGIPYIHVPTTLLSQVDSSIGGKTGINFKHTKNMLGTFYQPQAVFIDPNFLSTLTQKDIKEGMAEVIKYGAIMDKSLFSLLIEKHKEIIQLVPQEILKIISCCVTIKAKIVEKDEKEKKGIRTILNFGHTFAHALEGTNKTTHGEAVSIGMLFATYLSYRLKKCSLKTVEKVQQCLDLFSLPQKIDSSPVKLWQTMRYDKKFISGNVRMVILKEIGKVEVLDKIPLQLIKESLKSFFTPLN